MRYFDRFEKLVAALVTLLALVTVYSYADQFVVGSVNSSTILQVGTASPTPITNIRVFSSSLTPVATTALIQTVEQTFTVAGLTTADKVVVNGPVPNSLCPPVTFRVSATDTLAIGFSVLTVAICTPSAGTYNIIAVRS